MKKRNKIPVIFATKDDEYTYYLYVTMLSMLENASETTYYDFYILVPSDFSSKTKALLSKIKNGCSITFIDMQEVFKDAYKTKEHVNYPTFYRLLAADILTRYDKCIYLDTDIIVCGDLTEYYNTDINGYCLAGVKAPWYCENSELNSQRLGLPDTHNYINAGAILMNLQKIREDNLTSEFIKLMDRKFDSQDQDILNYACYGKIKILPYRYNFMTKFGVDYKKYIEKKIYTQTEIDTAIKNPLIIHYANKIKPWNDKNVFWGNIWWKYAKMTPFYKKLKKSLNSSIYKECNQPEQVKTVLLFSFIPLLKIKKYNRKTQCLFLSFIPLLEKKEKNNKIIYKIFNLFPVLKCNIKGE